MSTNARNYSLNEAMLGVLSIYFGKAYRIPSFVSSGFAPATLTSTATRYLQQSRIPAQNHRQPRWHQPKAQARASRRFARSRE
jgi:hypothetical protein